MATAAWRKYPNPHNPAVIGTDVVERTVVDGVLHTHRLVSSKWYFPRWTQAVGILKSSCQVTSLKFSNSAIDHVRCNLPLVQCSSTDVLNLDRT